MRFLRWFPQALRELRRRSGLSQRLLAEKARQSGTGVTQAMISQWERGEQRPTLESLDGLLDALGVSLADLASTAWLVAREHGEGGPDAEDGRPEAGSPSAQAAILDRQLGQLLERAPGRLPAEALLVSVVRAARSSLLYQQLLASEAHGMQRALWELLGNVALPEPAEPAAAEAEAERQAEAEVSR